MRLPAVGCNAKEMTISARSVLGDRSGDAQAALRCARHDRGVDRRRSERVVSAVVAAGAVIVVALWWHDTPAHSLHSLGDELTAAGRVTALVGTYLLLVQVLLMARLPWLDHAVGMDRLALWHRRNGEYVVSLLSAHAVAIIVGYALTDHVSIGNETARVVLHLPDVLAATVAMGLLIAIGLTSARALRTRMKYHTWYFVHLYAYLAVVLAFAHQLATGDQFATDAAARWFWVSLHVGTAALLLWYRVVVPARSAARHQLRVSAVRVESPDVVSLTVAGRHIEELQAESGQFFLWRFLTREGWWQAHPFSLSAAPTRSALRITVKAAGDHTNWLQHVAVGTRVFAEGPYGALTARRRVRRKVLFLAGGIGVTPLRALFESLNAGPGDMTFVYRAGAPADLVLRDELETLAGQRSARLLYALGPRDAAVIEPAALQRAIPDIAHHDAFVCGPPGFVDHAEAALVGAGVSRSTIHSERFEL
jgi:predicted ferric reductase